MHQLDYDKRYCGQQRAAPSLSAFCQVIACYRPVVHKLENPCRLLGCMHLVTLVCTPAKFGSTVLV